MDNILKNKKTIIICLVLVGIVMLFSLFMNNRSIFSSEEKDYEEMIEKYDANQYIPVYVTESDIANKYLNDFKNLMINDVAGAYEVINNSYKNEKFGNFEKFKEYVLDQYSLAFYNMSVKEYSVVNNNGYKYYYIRDSRDKMFIFKELSIMNYEVYLDDFTVEIK